MSRAFFPILFAILVGKRLLCSSQELQCNQYHNAPLCSGDTVTSTCSIQSPFVLWIIETTSEGDFEIDFDRGDHIGLRESTGMFSANLTKHYPDPSTDVSESILQYTFSERLNGSTFICANLLNQTLTKSCVIGNNESLPGKVKYVHVKTVQESCVAISISWNEPVTGSTIDYYLISLEPSTNQCGMQGCNISTTHRQMNLTGLENGISYNISVSACNSCACGLATTIQNVAMNLSKTELIERLVINSPINYIVEKADGTEYKVILIWEESLQSCAISYSVNVTPKDKAGVMNDTAMTNYYLLKDPIRREVIISVAGVNGDVIGPSSKVCIELEVPGNVIVTMKDIITTNLGHLLVLKWKPPENITCTRPSVYQYIVNFNKQSFLVMDKNFSMYLPPTMNTTQDYVNVSIIAVNVVGMGTALTFKVPPDVYPNRAITQTQPAVIYIIASIIIGLLITFKLDT